MLDESLIDHIYEAGALPELWPDLLERVASSVGAAGGILMCSHDQGQSSVCSKVIEPFVRAFEQQGWGKQNSRISRYLARPPYAGFLTDLDLHTEEELRTLPMYADFLVPNGADAGAATLVQGVGADRLALTIEGFPDHRLARSALGQLDLLRPHLARAATLSGRLRLERIRAAMEALELIGTPAGMLDLGGRLQAANASFQSSIGAMFLDRRSRLHLGHGASDRRFAAAIAKLIGANEGSTVPVELATDRLAALHIIPVMGSARDVFTASAGLVIVADPATSAIPHADVLQALFDLTPAEANVARRLASGSGIPTVADEIGVAPSTVRSHLKSVFDKTNTSRQSELSALLNRFGRPGG